MTPVGFSLWFLLLYSTCSTTTLKQVDSRRNRKKVIAAENLLDNDNDDDEVANFQPWKFAESEPLFTGSVEHDDNELVWTASAGKLVQLLDTGVYNKLQAPGQVTGVSTKVEVAVYIESMSTFRALTMDYEVDMYLMLSWQDNRLMHNSSHPILLTDWTISERMWHPDLYFVNAKFSYMHRVTTPNFMVVVYQDGFVMKTMRIDVTLACMLDLHDFPMDVQNCSAIVQSYAFVQNVVQLHWHTGGNYPIYFNPNIKINDMDVVQVTNSTCDSDYPLFRGRGRWSCLQSIITMKRKLYFHVFQIFIPSAMLVVISWLSFWLDIRASPARISLTITTLLTLTTMSNGSRQELPHVPYMKANDIWFAVCQAFVFCVLLEYTLVNLFLGWNLAGKNDLKIKRTPSENTSHPLLRSENERQKKQKTYRKDWERSAKFVDTAAKFIFPACFTLFIIVYWSVYTKP